MDKSIELQELEQKPTQTFLTYRDDERLSGAWETKESDLAEYPLQKTDQRFDYNKKKISARQANEPIPGKDRAEFFHRMPKNDAGAIRGIVDEEKNLLGAICHPRATSKILREDIWGL